MSTFEIRGQESFGRLIDKAKQYQSTSERSINKVLHEQAGPVIGKSAKQLIHASGRRFKGHTTSARSANPFVYDTSQNLAVTVAARGRWGYLYFPDDGTNTVRHAGNQQFMARGAEKESSRIMDMCIQAIVERL